MPLSDQHPTPAVESSLAVRFFGASDVGRIRSRNEDQFLIARLRKAMRVEQCSFSTAAKQFADEEGYLFLVADGMGGHAGGETASALTIESIQEFALNSLKWFFHFQGPEGTELLQEFEVALRQADARLLAEAAFRPELAGMGTTVTLAFVLGDAAFVAHVGDSRCYLHREGQLHQVTHDHTLLESLDAEGQAPADKTKRERLSHILTNVIGGPHPGIHVDVHKIPLRAGDQLLLCTDGINGMLSHEEIARIIHEASDERTACDRLISEGNLKGGRDNLTAIVTRFEGR